MKKKNHQTFAFAVKKYSVIQYTKDQFVFIICTLKTQIKITEIIVFS